MAISDEAGQSRLFPVAGFAAAQGTDGIPQEQSPVRLQADQIYERALTAVVQIISAT